jgi:hypothetical protein
MGGLGTEIIDARVAQAEALVMVAEAGAALASEVASEQRARGRGQRERHSVEADRHADSSVKTQLDQAHTPAERRGRGGARHGHDELLAHAQAPPRRLTCAMSRGSAPTRCARRRRDSPRRTRHPR